jgi:hypothetical protein
MSLHDRKEFIKSATLKSNTPREFLEKQLHIKMTASELQKFNERYNSRSDFKSKNSFARALLNRELCDKDKI